MNLSTLRAQFEEVSGRSDLVNSDGSDNGANFYIQAGQKYLDRRSNFTKHVGRIFFNISAGDYAAVFQHCRAVHKVFVADADERVELTKVDYDTLRGKTYYPDDYSQIDQAQPVYYSPAFLRLANDPSQTLSSGGQGVASLLDVSPGTDYEYNGVIFLPPADQAYTLEVRGLFYSTPLTADTDESYWSVAEPQVLLKAAMRELEVFYRNTEGVKDWTAAIEADLFGLDSDGVEEGIADVTQMEG